MVITLREAQAPARRQLDSSMVADILSMPRTLRSVIETHPSGLEFLYRKCSASEAAQSLFDNGLALGGAAIGSSRSEPHKWITRDLRYEENYMPKHAPWEWYSHIIGFAVEPGTIAELERLKRDGKLDPMSGSPDKAYGLPGEAVSWFNSRVIGVFLYTGSNEERSALVPVPVDFTILTDKNSGQPCYFVAFPPGLLVKNGSGIHFHDDISLDRFTWLKTSLRWLLSHSDFAREEGMTRILQIPAPPEHLDYLAHAAVRASIKREGDNVIYQEDPDRMPIAKVDPAKGHHLTFRRSGHTHHFAVTGDALLEFVLETSWDTMKDVTATARLFLIESRGLVGDLTGHLHRMFGLTPTTYQEYKA